jgi:esterase/lipase
MSGNHLWQAYLDHFDYFSRAAIREGCHPRLLEHPHHVDRAVVLVHGLSDSPYFMSFIGAYFHREMGYNVYLPLLHYHGLKDPRGMEGVEMEEWLRNVRFALDCAEEKAGTVSIGGLSTGGVLSFLMANARPGVNGILYLFSAALDLAGGPLGLIGDMKEWILRTFLSDLFDRNKPLIGDNPYRYSHVDIDGAQELARLIKNTNTIIKGFSAQNRFPLPVFAAHSEADTTANIAGIERLQRVCDPGKFHFERFPEKLGIPHASVVLKEPISGIAKPEPANPQFDGMMAAVRSFEMGQLGE